ncbi:hypothetical protein [Pseudothermotoga sp.]|nr:hypothetical protein [Pseudothermotoga sp.]
MSDCEELLRMIAQRFDCKIWVCEKMGKRISHVRGLKAGEEKYIEPTVVFEDERYIVFVESEELCNELKELCAKVIECVRGFTKDFKTSGSGNS